MSARLTKRIASLALLAAGGALGGGGGCYSPPVVKTGDGSGGVGLQVGSGGAAVGTGGAGAGGTPGTGGVVGTGGRGSGGASGTGGSTGSGGASGTGGTVGTGGRGTGGTVGTGGRGSGGASGTGGSTGSGGSIGSNPTACPATTARSSLCSGIPRLTPPASYSLDGVGTELCAVPPMEFAVASLPWINPAHATSRPATVTLRVAWSDDALWAHVHVKDAAVFVDSAATLWNGDNVQIFFAGTSNLTGTYSGTQDGGATHVIVVPPIAGGAAARAITLYETGFGQLTMGIVPTSSYAARLVSDGYEVELRLPWAASAQPRTSGAAVGFNFMAGVSDSGTGVELEAALANNPVSSSVSCYNIVHPGCDDRTWCKPLLQ
jgi:hypothetical protein